MKPASRHHQVVIVGGGNAGISVAARLQRAGEKMLLAEFDYTFQPAPSTLPAR